MVQRMVVIALVLALGVPYVVAAPPETTGQAMERVGGYLVDEQILDGPNAGAWPFETDYTGSIVAGLARAYMESCESGFKDAAMLGGEFIHQETDVEPEGYYGLGDEAYAVALLSEISDDPANNIWRQRLAQFYAFVAAGQDGTPGFISYYLTGAEPSTAVIYLAYHTVAAYYVDAADKLVWRNSLRDYLSRVDDDTAKWPVMALGIATWALAQTGPLDLAPVDTGSDGQPIWDGVQLADLPEMLEEHQVDSGALTGSFYWRFDHTDGTTEGDGAVAGFTEDTLYGAMGLVAAAKAYHELPNIYQKVAMAREALLQGILDDGGVRGHLAQVSPIYYLYAGETLLALGESASPADIFLDDAVDMEDLAWLSQQWGATCPAGYCKGCGGADLNRDGVVDSQDLMILANEWLVY